jgi:hypothetical protein
MLRNLLPRLAVPLLVLCASSAGAATVLYNNDFPDGRIATASRPAGPAGERETADDFVLTAGANVTGAAFTGLMPADAKIKKVVVEIYHVFPNDSDLGRTIPPTIPTRVNSPSDVAFGERVSGTDLQFIATPLQNSFTATNSVVNGIAVGTGGEGPVTGQEVRVNVSFTSPLTLPADHYFFVPQVELSNGNFLWLSANRPIATPGTPIVPDLQTWIRNDPGIAPDWLRVGTDVVHGTTFNASFLVFGEPVPEASSLSALCIGLGLAAVAVLRRRT